MSEMRRALPLLAITLAVLLSACARAASPAPPQGLREKAALEATAIIERAEATAIVLRAQATAAALTQVEVPARPTPSAPVALNAPPASATQRAPATPTPASRSPTPSVRASPRAEGEEDERDESEAKPAAPDVELLAVSIGEGTGYVVVQFRAVPKVAEGWAFGSLSVTDEATGMVYKEVVTLPVIGPLFARPKRADQVGYVMFRNIYPLLVSGAKVTVALGSFKQEHVTVR